MSIESKILECLKSGDKMTTDICLAVKRPQNEVRPILKGLVKRGVVAARLGDFYHLMVRGVDFGGYSK